MRPIRTFVLLVCLPLCACADGGRTLVLLHTNDMHAAFLPREAAWSRENPKPMVGGFNELAFAVDSIRQRHPGALLLDAGDFMTGNPIADMVHDGAYGGALIAMMNRIGYDAASPGNHDLDISQENLRALVGLARFPFLCANMAGANGLFPENGREYVILEREGVRIGLFGLMSQDLYGLVNQNNLKGIRVLSPDETARRLVAELDPQTDLVVALTHQGAREDSILAAAVPGLDVIVGGHSHTRITAPRAVHGALIVQTGSSAENLGVLELTVQDDRVAGHRGGLIPLWARTGRTTRLTPMIDSLRAEVDSAYAEVIAVLSEDWKRGEGETGIGNFILDAMTEAAGAEIGFTNSHGIRRDVPAGPLTRRTLYEVMPFRNTLVTFQLSGSRLRAVVEHYLARRPAIQMSGITCTWRRRPGGGPEILSLEVNGSPLDTLRGYTCATSDFFVSQARDYLGTEIEQAVYLRPTVFEVLENAARRAGTISNRMRNWLRQAP
ncbi:MAG: bifunctional UDP-sugar hydrolase/5'-nucleotidase [Bacteroidota bacterium]